VALSYAYCLRLPLFFDDLPIISWLSGRGIGELWLGQDGGYYRPLAYLVYALGRRLPPNLAPVALHAASLILLWISALLLASLVNRVSAEPAVALSAGVMLPFYPLLSQAIPWVTAMVHPLALTLCLAGARLVLSASSSRYPRLCMVSALLAIAAAPLAHESGAVAGTLALGFVILTHGFSWRWLLTPLLGIGTNVAVLAARSALPGTASASFAGLSDWYANAMYFCQGLLYPLGRAVRLATIHLGWHDLSLYAVLSLAIVGGALATARERSDRRLLLAGLLWWALGAMPAALSLRFADLYIAPRLYTLCAPGAVMFWAALLHQISGLLRLPAIRKATYGVLTVLLLLAGGSYLRQQRQLYLSLTGLYDGIMDACTAQGRGSQLGLINLPRGLFREDRTFALTTDDVLFIPHYSNLTEFLAVNGAACSAEVATVASLSVETEPIWLAQGDTLGPEKLRLFARQHDALYLSRPVGVSGGWELVASGAILSATGEPCEMAAFEPGPLLCAAEIVPVAQGIWQLALEWLARDPQDATVFVHVVDASGALVAQADGAPVSGALPFSALIPGDRVLDIRRLDIPPEALLPARVYLGLYLGDQRHPVLAGGIEQADGGVLVAEIAP